MSLKYVCANGDVVDFANQKNIIILSPSYYWYVQKKVPIKNIRKVKKLASSVLVGRAENMNAFHILKIADSEYGFYAYDEKFVEKVVHESRFNECDVYFANQINFSSDIKIDDERCLKSVLDVIVEAKEQCEAKTINSVVNESGFKSKTFYVKSDKSKALHVVTNVALVLFGIVVVLNLVLDGIKVSKLSEDVQNLGYGDKNSYAAASLTKKYTKFKKEKEKIMQGLKRTLKSSTGAQEIIYDGVNIEIK